MDSPHPLLLRSRLALRTTTTATIACAVLVAASACTSSLQTPLQIGDCVSDGSTTCVVVPPSGGIELPVDGGSEDATGEIISESLDGGSCGTVDTLVIADCSACIIQSCCMSDSLCSRDTNGCLLELECAAVGTPCPSLTPASQTNYDDLLQCIDLYCQSQCLTVANHDI